MAIALALAASSKRLIASRSSLLISAVRVATRPALPLRARARSSKARARRVFSSCSALASRIFMVPSSAVSRSMIATRRAAISTRAPAAAVAELVAVGAASGWAGGLCLGCMLLALLLAEYLAHDRVGHADAPGPGHHLRVFLVQHVAEGHFARAAAERAVRVDAGEHVRHHLREEQRLELLGDLPELPVLGRGGPSARLNGRLRRRRGCLERR